MRGKYEHKPPEMEGRSPQSGKFLERLACIGPGPCGGANNGDDDGSGALRTMMVMVVVVGDDHVGGVLFKGILGHGSEVGFWSILDGDGRSLGVLGQPHGDVGKAGVKTIVALIIFNHHHRHCIN